MPAGPIGTSWALHSWTDTAWQANSWAASGSIVGPSVFGDLTTLFERYVEVLAAVHTGADDAATQVNQNQATVRAAEPTQNDLNTAYADYLS